MDGDSRPQSGWPPRLRRWRGCPFGLVRTLRELDVDLPTIRRVVNRELPLPAVAAAHAEALDVQIRILRLRRAVREAHDRIARQGKPSRGGRR